MRLTNKQSESSSWWQQPSLCRVLIINLQQQQQQKEEEKWTNERMRDKKREAFDAAGGQFQVKCARTRSNRAESVVLINASLTLHAAAASRRFAPLVCLLLLSSSCYVVFVSTADFLATVEAAHICEQEQISRKFIIIIITCC